MKSIIPKKIFLCLSIFLTIGAAPLRAQLNYSTTKYCPTDPPTIFTENNAPTWYTLTGVVNCSYPNSAFDNNHYAALNDTDYAASGGCGSCIVANNGGFSTTIMVVDSCPAASNPPCVPGTHHIDFAPAAYNELVCGSPTCSPGGPPGSITWHFIECPMSLRSYAGTGGNLAYTFKSGSTQFWAEISFINQLFPIVQVEIMIGASWTVLPR